MSKHREDLILKGNDVKLLVKTVDIDLKFDKHVLEIYKALQDNSRNSLRELFVRRKSTINLLSMLELVIPLVNSVL